MPANISALSPLRILFFFNTDRNLHRIFTCCKLGLVSHALCDPLISSPFSCVFSWSTSDLRSQCHVTLTNTGRRELKGSVSVREAVYEARSGIVGGHIEIQEFKMRGTKEFIKPCFRVNSGFQKFVINDTILRYMEPSFYYMGGII